MAASASPMQGTRRGRHQAPSSFQPRALLGPIGSHSDWQPPEDPYQLGERQSAGVATVPAPTVETAAPSVAAARTPAALRVLGGLAQLAALLVAGMALARVARSAPMSPAEAAQAVRVVAVARPDVGALPGGSPQRVFEAVAAGWVSLTGALHREPGATLAVRESTVLAAGVALLLVWLLAVRLRLSVPTRVALVLACGAVPFATGILAGAAHPGVFTALLVVAAATVISGVRVPAPRKVVALVLLALALLLVPALAGALAATFAVLVWQGDLGRRLRRPVRRVLGALLVAVALAAVAGYARGPVPAWLGTGAGVGVPRPSTVEFAVAGLLLASTALAARQRWLRAPAAAVFTLLVTAVVAAPALADLLAVALPLAVLVGLAHAEELAVRYAGRWHRRRARTFGPTRRTRAARGTLPWRGAAVAAALALLVVLGTGWLVLRRPAAVPPAPPAGAVVGWFASEVTGTPVVATDDALWPALVAAGLPASRLHSPTSAPGTPAGDWLVSAGAPAAGYTGYARFGPLVVAHRGPGGATAAPAGDAAALAANPALHLAPPAAAALTAGRVDARLISVLATFAGNHTLDIADFPAVPGEAPAAPATPPLRRALITAVDGNPVTQPTVAALASTWFDRQLGPYHPCGIQPAGTALLLRYCLTA